MFDTRELGRRAGALKRVSRTVQAPEDLGIEVIGVPKGAPVQVELRMESVIEGVLVTGTVRAPLAGECVRCLEPVDREVTADFQEMFSYPDSEGAHRQAEPEDEEAEEETYLLQGDLFDLEPVVRDAVVLALPLQPVCREDCPGLCPECGALLAEEPDHRHEDVVDVRWAALRDLSASLRAAESAQPDQQDKQEKPPRGSGDDPQEK